MGESSELGLTDPRVSLQTQDILGFYINHILSEHLST